MCVCVLTANSWIQATAVSPNCKPVFGKLQPHYQQHQPNHLFSIEPMLGWLGALHGDNIHAVL